MDATAGSVVYAARPHEGGVIPAGTVAEQRAYHEAIRPHVHDEYHVHEEGRDSRCLHEATAHMLDCHECGHSLLCGMCCTND